MQVSRRREQISCQFHFFIIINSENSIRRKCGINRNIGRKSFAFKHKRYFVMSVLFSIVGHLYHFGIFRKPNACWHSLEWLLQRRLILDKKSIHWKVYDLGCVVCCNLCVFYYPFSVSQHMHTMKRTKLTSSHIGWCSCNYAIIILYRYCEHGMCFIFSASEIFVLVNK